MNVLHVVHSADPNGGGVIEAILQFVRGQLDIGVNAEIASLDCPDDCFIKEPGITHYAIGSGGGYGKSETVDNWLNDNISNYDGIIVHGLWQHHGVAVRKYALRYNVPYFVFTHGMLDPWFRKKYPLKHLKKQVYWLLFGGNVLKDAKNVCFTCEEEKRLAEGSFYPYQCKPAIVHLGLKELDQDTNGVKKCFYEEYPDLENEKLILFLGRIHEKKGVDHLLKAFAQLKSEGMTDGYKLVMAGPPSSEEYLQELKGFVSENDIEDEVVWTGMLTGDRKWGAICAADVFVLPSHQENFGIAVAEALMNSVPVLISDKVNIWREIKESGAGIVGTDDLDGTTQMLKQWMCLDPSVKLEMRQNAKQCFEGKFQISKAVSHLNEVLGTSQEYRLV